MNCLGQVIDSTGNPMANVQCNVIDTTSGNSLATFYSDSSGYYDFQMLNDPDLEVIFSYPGYIDKQVQLSGDQDTCITMSSTEAQNAHENISIGDINTVVLVVVLAIIFGLIFF